MGRKVEMKKIEDVTKCQVTFSKRRSSLMKKANEISICCDVDIAFITFSPSGRVSKYCNHKRIEEVLHRYVNLPTEKRYGHIRNVQAKQEKLHQLDHIKSETSKLQYLDKQIENLELQNKKCALELQIMEADMRDFEPFSEQEPSLHQLMWCEKNLKRSLQRVINRKDVLLSGRPSCSSYPKQHMVEGTNFGTMEINRQGQSGNPSHVDVVKENPIVGNRPNSDQLLMQLDPWISPYSANVREDMFHDLVDGDFPIAFSNQQFTQSNFGFTNDMEIDYQGEVPPPLPSDTLDYQTMNPNPNPNPNPNYESYTLPSMPPTTTTNVGSSPTLANPTKPNHFNMEWMEAHLMGEDFGCNKNSKMVIPTETHDTRQDKVIGTKDVTTTHNNSFEEAEKAWNNGIEAASLWEWEELLLDNLNGNNLATLF